MVCGGASQTLSADKVCYVASVALLRLVARLSGAGRVGRCPGAQGDAARLAVPGWRCPVGGARLVGQNLTRG